MMTLLLMLGLLQLPPQVGQVLSTTTLCTAFPITAQGHWITASHCLGENLLLDGAPATVYKAYAALDLVILSGPKRTPFPLALAAPKVGEMVQIQGYFKNIPAPLVFTGHVAHVRIDTPPGFTPPSVMLIHKGGGGGSSGAPVLVNGKVVGVVVAGLPEVGFLSMAVVWQDLKPIWNAF